MGNLSQNHHDQSIPCVRKRINNSPKRQEVNNVTTQKTTISLPFIFKITFAAIAIVLVIGFILNPISNPFDLFIALSGPAIFLREKLEFLPTSVWWLIPVIYLAVCALVSLVFCTIKSCTTSEFIITCISSTLTASVIHALGFFITILPHAG